MRCIVIPVVWVGQLGWFGQIMEAIDARTRLAHGLAVEATAIKVGQLLPVVLLILIWVIVVGTHYIVQGLSMGLLGLRSPAEKVKRNKQNSCRDLNSRDRQRDWPKACWTTL